MRTFSFNLFLPFCLLVWVTVASLGAGCRSPEAKPADDEPTEKSAPTAAGAEVCEPDSVVPQDAAVSAATQAPPLCEASLFRDVWQRALDHLGPQALTQPPTQEACETATVLKRIGISQADAILSRCAAPDSKLKAPPAAKRAAPPAVSESSRDPQGSGSGNPGTGGDRPWASTGAWS